MNFCIPKATLRPNYTQSIAFILFFYYHSGNRAKCLA